MDWTSGCPWVCSWNVNPHPPPSYFYSLSTFSFFKMRNYLDKVNDKFKSFSLFDQICLKWNQMTHCLDRIGFLKKIWFSFDIVMGWGGEPHRLFTVASLTLTTTMRGERRSHLKQSTFTFVTPFPPFIWFESVWSIASPSPWANSCTFFREWSHAISRPFVVLFEPFWDRFHFHFSLLFIHRLSSCVPCWCYPSCLVHDPHVGIIQQRDHLFVESKFQTFRFSNRHMQLWRNTTPSGSHSPNSIPQIWEAKMTLFLLFLRHKKFF